MHTFKLQALKSILLSVCLSLELRMLEELPLFVERCMAEKWLEEISGTTSASAWDGLVSRPLVQILMFGLDC